MPGYCLARSTNQLRLERCKLACRIYLFPGFLDREEAGHIVELAQRRLRPSGLAYKKGDTEANNR